MKYFISFIIFLGMSSFVYGQSLKEFSDVPAEFMNQLDEHMNRYKNEKTETIFKTFKKNYEIGAYSKEQLGVIHTVCDTMLKFKLNVSPYFTKYIENINTIKGLESSGEKFDDYNRLCLEVIGAVENRNFKKYDKFLKFIVDFYENSMLRKVGGSEWKVIASQHKITLDSNQLAIHFEKADLMGIRDEKDSIVIKETSGIYFPFIDTWRGEKGKVSWDRVGIDDVYAELGKYEFDVKKNAYTSKDATLYFPKYFPGQAIKGTFEDRAIVKSSSSRPTFPKFESYEKILRINNIGADVQYVGGFKLSGTTVYGTGDKDNKAKITVLNATTNAPAMVARSLEFIIREDVGRIISERAEISLLFGNDSIYHPSSNLRFEIKEKELTLKRGDRGTDKTPFMDSYHNINLEADRLDWLVDTDTISISKKVIGIGGGNEKEVSIESLHYYSEGVYRELQNISTINPIATFLSYSRDMSSDTLDAGGLAYKINPKFDESSIKRLLYAMVARGFVDYNEDESSVILKEKIRHYALAAVEKSDYDHINIKSKTKETNALLYLNEENENPIDVRAVPYLEFSPVHRVAVKPLNNQLMIKKDRNMEFSGKVFGGLTVFQGNGFQFKYQDFSIKMDSIKYMDLFEYTGEDDEDGNPIAYSIDSRIENVTGVLLIDAPYNKSGKEELDMFPTFTSTGPSYVYYDDRAILDGIYTRDSFYFRLDKFGFNNIDRYTVSDIKFKGEMYSADIFPPFEERLVLMGEDKSLGFVHETPANGYANYVRGNAKGKSTYIGQITLNNQGFTGVGKIKYLNADINSEDIIFRPNNATGSARRFDLEEKRNTNPEMPQVRGVDINFDFQPYKDTLYVYSEEFPFAMFKSGLHTLEGSLALTPGGLWGDGLLDWDKASMTSKSMKFGAYSLDSEKMDIGIKSIPVSDQLAFDSRDVNGSLDFDKGIGKFKANSNEITTSMPYNKYKTSMNEFIWDMNAQTVEFKSKEGKLDEFLSPELDSLQFQGETATYDIKSSTLKIGGVPFIKTADALVYPVDGNVEIIAGGAMKTLENAQIVASEKSKYHVINKATVKIKGGRDYTASGYYEFNIGDKEQEILFSDIVGAPIGKGKRNEKELATRGKGTVTTQDNFYVDHKTKFRGDISLSSNIKDLKFKGYAILDSDALPQKHWFTVDSKGDKKNLAITINEPKNPDGEPLRTGLFVDRAAYNPYPSVLGILYARKDRALMDIKGVFKYDKSIDTYIFGDSIKLTNNNHYTGNVFTVNNQTGTCKATGSFNVGEGVKFFKPRVVGQAKIMLPKFLESVQKDTTDSPNTNAYKQDLEMDLMAAIDYYLPEEAVKAIVKDLQTNTVEAPNISLPANYDKMIWDIVGGLVKNEDDYNQIIKNYQTTKKVTLPKDESLFFFSYLPMKWSPSLQSLVSSKRKLGLSQLKGQSINKMVEAYIEFRMPYDVVDDGMHVYIKNPVEGGHYYFFQYKHGLLQTISSNPEYMSAIEGAKKKDLEVKYGKEGTYKISTLSGVSVEMFLSRVKNAW